jgi:hypothetical protein
MVVTGKGAGAPLATVMLHRNGDVALDDSLQND